MLEAKFKAGEVIFFAGLKGMVEKHPLKGSFQDGDVLRYVITPHGVINTIVAERVFSTFEEARACLVDIAKEQVKAAEGNLIGISNVEESSAVEYPDRDPTAQELEADQKATEESEEAIDEDIQTDEDGSEQVETEQSEQEPVEEVEENTSSDEVAQDKSQGESA